MDDDVRSVLEAMLRASKNLPKPRRHLVPTAAKRPSQCELSLRLLRIQEHILSAKTVDARTSDDIGLLLDRVTTILERQC
jgi:hypothetical protein